MTYSGTVEVVLEEMIKCVSDVNAQTGQKPALQWIGTESDNIVQPNYLQSEKRKMHWFYLGLLKTVIN